MSRVAGYARSTEDEPRMMRVTPSKVFGRFMGDRVALQAYVGRHYARMTYLYSFEDSAASVIVRF